MKKTLLIHASNTPNNVQKSFSPDNTINFKFDKDKYTNIDEYISTVIIEALQSKDFDLIYIKDSLSSSYLELHGLVLAYHIRLSVELGDERYVPIVILSDVDGYTLNKIIPMAKILFTQNVYLEANKLETIKRYDQKDIKLLSSKEYEINFLEHVSVDAPENSSSHSIANEWAIYRWAEFLNINDKEGEIENNKLKIASMLYFKYLLAKNPISKNSSIYSCVYPVHTGNILLIDDEHDKGWSAILEGYFLENPKTKFHTFDYDFKKENYNAPFFQDH